ncbi:SAM-dependent methyltransferase [Actinomadura luteofluorescens]|uniref:O-methyltransferase involved in polyketide biosynthesis n=1 Tax=Actinomadura luteofluorescens TaxID=46163 RepID=A0A7Y9JCV8_9ACTN|nr:SAM-dependent methyltransferase [Actinomadura luteofluorescens]NYD44347.1 O-methyltransferase involved in polyketide biosynthesis [Actinomadura luteofluorescens]
MPSPAGHEPQTFDPSAPNESRMHDYLLGGKDNYAADRQAALQAIELAPELPVLAREGRKFLDRVVRFLAAAGIRQFLDIGTGLPTQGSVHQIAQAVAPDCRVVYVDNDPVVRVHAQALLGGDARTTVVEADMRDAEGIAHHPNLRRLIDLDQPTALLFFHVLYTIPDDEEAARSVRRLGELMAPGSHIAISHPVSDLCPEVTARLAFLYQQETHAIRGTPRSNVRTRAEVEKLFSGWDLIEPGVVYLPLWRPEHETIESSRPIWSVGGVGRKP